MSKKLIIGIALLAVLLVWSLISIYPDWLWFKNLNFSPVFWTMLLSKFGFGTIVWLLLILIISINFFIARRLILKNNTVATQDNEVTFISQLGLSNKALNTLLIAFVLLLSFIVASKSSSQWDMILRYLYQQPFGNTDPIFGKDIGFYVFSLPLYTFIQNGLLILIVLAGLITIAWYLKEGALQIVGEFVQSEEKPISFPKITIIESAKKHIIFLGGLIVILLAWSFYLKLFSLLYSTQGPAFGASYTDVHVKILAYKIMIPVTLAFAFMVFLEVFRPRKKLTLISGGIWLGAILISGTIVPILVQKFIVQPNELAKEATYIAYNIDNTRKAYNLNKIKEVDFSVSDTLTEEVIRKNNVTIQNIRIWDERPLLQTYRQIQAIRLYYDFHNIDVDRYLINNQYRQVMLSARELVVDKLPPQARTWVNKHLIYTHGYGLALSPVNEVTPEGLPDLLIKDLPPSFETDLIIDRPEIYYGEKTDQYVLVKTKAKEFDYPKGDKNVYTIYQGNGGVPINSFIRRMLFAVEFLDPQIFFTTYLNPDSKIMYKRRVDRRVRSLAPFLSYDGDPYLVVSKGRLYWIQDAYTTSNMYPYSRPFYGKFNKGLNYIRNSIKITIDAYNGDVCFYLIDEKDPIAKTYSSIFPDLFKPFNEMPPDLIKHVRYPKDLFEIQADSYRTYHMEDTQVFYNQEDLWQVPDELYGETRQEMEPYYVILKLPEDEKEEYFLMLPFTPSKKDNMIGWLAARSDFPNYGNLVIYKLSKEKLVYGPMQIEARVDQQTDISKELSLWGQRGSRVIRGNLLAIPLSDTFIYVEPVYLEAKQEEASPAAASSQPSRFQKNQGNQKPVSSELDQSRAASLPELKRVIVAFSNRIIMEDDLEQALNKLLGMKTSLDKYTSPGVPKTLKTHDLGVMALEHYNKAKDYLRQGDWAGYGKELGQLEEILRNLSELSKKDSD